MRDGVSPGSMAYISNGRIDGWSLLAKRAEGQGLEYLSLELLVVSVMSIAAACVGFSTFACFFPTFPTYSSCLPREILFLFPFFFRLLREGLRGRVSRFFLPSLNRFGTEEKNHR